VTRTVALDTHVHVFEPARREGAPTLLLLHGTGGDEHDLLGLGRQLDADAGLLGVRGNVLEHGMRRYFRRIREGVFDLEDLERRTQALADFVEAACAAYGLEARRVIAVGYSNGANVAASMLLRRPGTFGGAVLFRPMVPLTPERLPDLEARPVLIAAGRADPIVPAAESERLAAMLKEARADVTVNWSEAGHGLVGEEIDRAVVWLAAHTTRA